MLRLALRDAEALAELAALAPNLRIVTGLTSEQALERAAEANGCPRVWPNCARWRPPPAAGPSP